MNKRPKERKKERKWTKERYKERKNERKKENKYYQGWKIRRWKERKTERKEQKDIFWKNDLIMSTRKTKEERKRETDKPRRRKRESVHVCKSRCFFFFVCVLLSHRNCECWKNYWVTFFRHLNQMINDHAIINAKNFMKNINNQTP